MSTEAPDTTTNAPAWQLETANGSLRPRSALDVLVDLNDKVTTGQVSEYQPVPGKNGHWCSETNSTRGSS